jgi:hypothetical protein
VKDVLSSNAELMYPHELADQSVVGDVVGGNTLWDEKFIRRA